MSRRDAIVSAAARFFAERGYAAVGMRDVGVRGASLHPHLASKEEILYAICLTVTEEPNAQNLPLLDAPGTAADRLSALVRGHLHHLHRRRTEHIVGGELSLDEVADGYVDLIVGRMLGGRERK